MHSHHVLLLLLHTNIHVLVLLLQSHLRVQPMLLQHVEILLLLASWFSCIFCNILSIIMFTLSAAGFGDSLTEAYDATSIGVSGSSIALCLRLSSLSAIRLLLRVLDGLRGCNGDENEGRLSHLGSDGLG
jgi:hypothetical protein